MPDYSRGVNHGLLPWILATLALFVVQTLLPMAFRLLRLSHGKRSAELAKALGPRDEMAPLGAFGERAQRATANMQEALPVFCTLALLHVASDRSVVLAEQGAMLFFIARVVYVPAYITGIMGLRSAAWIAGWGGLVMMLAALR